MWSHHCCQFGLYYLVKICNFKVNVLHGKFYEQFLNSCWSLKFFIGNMTHISTVFSALLICSNFGFLLLCLEHWTYWKTLRNTSKIMFLPFSGTRFSIFFCILLCLYHSGQHMLLSCFYLQKIHKQKLFKKAHSNFGEMIALFYYYS